MAWARMIAIKVMNGGQNQGAMLNVRLVELANRLDICSRKRKESNITRRLWD